MIPPFWWETAVNCHYDVNILSLQLPRNPYGSNEGTPCGCRLPVVTLQPQWVRFGAWGAVGRLHWSFVVMVRRGRQALLGQPSEGFSSPSAPPQLPALRWLCASREPLTPVTPQAPGNAGGPLAQ